MKRAFLKVAGVSAGLMLASSAPAVWALSVSPPRTEIRVPPSGKSEIVITVANPDAEFYDVVLTEKPWFVLPDNKAIQVPDWLILPHSNHFRLKAGKKREVKIKIKCPEKAVGELMGMVSFAYKSKKDSMITPMISVAVYVEVVGTEKNAGEITILSAGTKEKRFQVGVQVKATGNVRVHPAGTIQLLNEQRQEVSKYAVQEANPIFPGSMRDYPASGPSTVPAPGHYILVTDLFSGSLEMKAERKMTVKENGDVEMAPVASQNDTGASKEAKHS